MQTGEGGGDFLAGFKNVGECIIDGLPRRRVGREAEGGGLLNRYTLSRGIVGSNPISSASLAPESLEKSI